MTWGNNWNLARPKSPSASPRWRNYPPPGYGSGYQSFYPMAAGALADYEAFARHLSSTLSGEVLGYEAYSEPNLWAHIYPQRTGDDPWFSVHLYLTYLKAFSAGSSSHFNCASMG